MADDHERQRIATHFREALLRRNPDTPQPVQEAFLRSLEQTLRDALGAEPIAFVELIEGQRHNADDLGSALILAGNLLYALSIQGEELRVAFIGAPVGGIYREDIELANGEIVRTRITYEHPRLAELNQAIGFIFTPADAGRYIGIRTRLRAWGRRGIRVWGGRT
jgi:hypothetical protein